MPEPMFAARGRAALLTILAASGAVLGVLSQVATTSAAYQDQTHGRTASVAVEAKPLFQPGLSRNSRMVDTGMGLGNDGNVYMWGRTNLDIGGSVPNPGTDRPPTSIPAMPDGGMCQVTGQIYDADALACDGTVWGWGSYDNRNGTDAARPNEDPKQVRVGSAWNGAGALLDGVLSISSTEQAGAGIRNDGSVWIWGGSTSYGGNGTTLGASMLSGLPDPTLPGNRPVHLKGAYQNFFLVLENGDVYTWGGASSLPGGGPALSTVAVKVNALSPWFRSNVPDTAPHVVEVDGGINMGAAILSDGQVLSWSRSGSSTRIGNRPTSPTPASAPGIVPLLSGVKTMQFGFTGVVFETDANGLWGYGASDDYGQLPMSPGQVDTGVVQYAVGQGYYLWQKSDGTFWGRGYNPAGAIGTPDSGAVTTNRQVSYDMSAVTR